MKKILCLFLLGILPATPGFAISEENYAEAYIAEVKPFIDAQARPWEFTGVDGIRLKAVSYSHADSAKALVVLVNGRAESYLEYGELVYDLYQRGFDVVSFDHRGQGLSERMVKDSQMSYVREFPDYVHDFSHFMNEVSFRHDPTIPKVLLAHSMGGLVASQFIVKHPDAFKSAVLSSPMVLREIPTRTPRSASIKPKRRIMKIRKSSWAE